MTHTKEPWAVKYYTCRADAGDVKYERERPLKRGETRRDLKAGDALWRQPLSIGDIAPDHCHWAGNHLSCDEETAERVAALWNALAGIPDPAAFVQAARGMAEALIDAGDVLKLVSKPARLDPDKYFSDQVQAMGDAFGYGALMSAASALWRERLGDLAGGEFAAGPCVSTAANQVVRISEALAAFREQMGEAQ